MFAIASKFYIRRKYAQAEKMNRFAVLFPAYKEDKVIMNGDFALCGKERIIEIGLKLNGRKTLILGNHEGASLKTYYDAGFEMVSKYPIVFEKFYIVSHMPQYVPENSSYVNVFAHVHDNPAFKDVSARGFCTSAERIGYTPIEFKDIKARILAAAAL